MNRPALISVFSDQRRTKSTTRSRTSCGTHTLVRAPQDFFLRRCARPSMVRAALARGGRSAILEELFLPTIEYRWLQSQFITQIGNRHFIQQVPPQDGHLLFPGVVLSLFSHASSPLS